MYIHTQTAPFRFLWLLVLSFPNFAAAQLRPFYSSGSIDLPTTSLSAEAGLGQPRCTLSNVSIAKIDNVCLRKLAATFKMPYGNSSTLADEVQLGISSTTTPAVNCVQAVVKGGSYSKCPSCPNGNYTAAPFKNDNLLKGKEVRRLSKGQGTVDVSGLPAGLYWYVFEREGRSGRRGRLVVGR